MLAIAAAKSVVPRLVTRLTHCRLVSKMTEQTALHDDIKPLAWLLGRWRGDNGVGIFPTIKDFNYGEELYFYHTGQHYIHFQTRSWDAGTKKPLHGESGFIRRQSDTNRVAITIATNIGFSELEEGELNGEELNVESRTIGGMSFFRLTPATKIKRLIRRDGDSLEQTLWMATEKTPLTQHLNIRYSRIQEDAAELKSVL
ncbi:peroxynitrite isomerase THAP4-like [Haliotis rubra]|uniref:peroxynitrite isomerase THAP4-like n=1 Tax=Haliotis rubra TaxID=36100 RepID=UPI001EE60EAE|nr:peroxynitrite isomerase THAP4-like [Haliotis rubra]